VARSLRIAWSQAIPFVDLCHLGGRSRAQLPGGALIAVLPD